MQEIKVIKTVKELVDSLKSTGFEGPLRDVRNAVADLLEYIDSTIGEVPKNDVETENLQTAPKEEIKANPNISPSLKYYSKEWSYRKKYIFVLKSENRFIHFREVAKIICDLDGEGVVEALTHTLSNTTRKLREAKKIVKVQHGTSLKNTFWGLPEWLNQDGTIKEGHEYKTDVLNWRSDSGSQKTVFELI